MELTRALPIDPARRITAPYGPRLHCRRVSHVGWAMSRYTFSQISLKGHFIKLSGQQFYYHRIFMFLENLNPSSLLFFNGLLWLTNYDQLLNDYIWIYCEVMSHFYIIAPNKSVVREGPDKTNDKWERAFKKCFRNK